LIFIVIPSVLSYLIYDIFKFSKKLKR
jgi:hypothetical protein